MQFINIYFIIIKKKYINQSAFAGNNNGVSFGIIY